jgi:hypothetical protein
MFLDRLRCRHWLQRKIEETDARAPLLGVLLQLQRNALRFFPRAIKQYGDLGQDACAR